MFHSHFWNQRHFDHSHNNYCSLSKSYYLFYFRKCFHCCFIKYVQMFFQFWGKIWESGQYHWIILMFFISNNFVHSKFPFIIKRWYDNDISSFHNKKLKNSKILRTYSSKEDIKVIIECSDIFIKREIMIHFPYIIHI